MKTLLRFSFLFVITCIFTTRAHADPMGDLSSVYGYFAAGSAAFDGPLPTQSDFDSFKNALSACTTGPDECITAVTNTPWFQDNSPSWVIMWVNVYFDLQQADYWALLADAGQAIACVAADIIFGSDICKAIKVLVDAAVAIAKGIESALQFLGDVLSDAGGALKAVGCALTGGLWPGCDDSSPQPPDDVVAYTNFYYPRVPDGLWNREASPGAWNTYKTAVVSDCSAQTGLPAGCNRAYPAFEKSVLAAWNADEVQKWIPQVKNRQHDQWTAETVGKHLGDVPGVSFLDTSEPWSFNSWIVKLVSQECGQDLTTYGAREVQDWMDDGGPAQAKIAPPWSSIASLCTAFNNAFQQTAWTTAFNEGVVQINQTGICSKVTDSPLVYDCQEKSYKFSPQTTDCNTVLVLGSLDPKQCFPPRHWDCPAGSGGTGVSLGNNKNVRKKGAAPTEGTKTITLLAHQPPPQGCQNADVSVAPPVVTMSCNGKKVTVVFGSPEYKQMMQDQGCTVDQGIGIGSGTSQNPMCQQLKGELIQAIQDNNSKAVPQIQAQMQKLGCDSDSQGTFDPNPH